MKHSKIVVLCTLSLFMLAGSIHTSSDEKTKAWNPEVVQAQTDELLDAAERLVRECRTSPPNYLGDITSNSHIEFRYHVRHFRSVAAELSMAIENGKGRDWTAPMYNELLDIMEDLKRYAVDNPRGAWVPVERAIIEADNALQELGASYSK